MLPATSLEEEFLRFQATGRQHRGCITPQAVTYSLVLLKMGGIIARNMLSWLELLINRYCCIYLVFISFMWMCVCVLVQVPARTCGPSSTFEPDDWPNFTKFVNAIWHSVGGGAAGGRRRWGTLQPRTCQYTDSGNTAGTRNNGLGMILFSSFLQISLEILVIVQL